MRKVAVLFNPRSGSSGSAAQPSLRARLSELFGQRGVEPVLRTFDSETLASDVRGLLADQPEALIVVGGDGSVTSVAEYVLGSGVPLAVLPTGTMNMFARDLGVPDDLEAALDAVLAAPVQCVDVARVNGRLFLCGSALVMLPHLGRVREQARGASGWPWLRWLARGADLVRRYPRVRLDLAVDGRVRTVRTRAIVVTNNPLRSGPGPLPGRDRLDTGRLTVYVTRDRTHWDLVGVAARLFDGSWQRAKRLRIYQGRAVEVSSARLQVMSVMNDGEVTQETMPLSYQIQPESLAVLAPGAGA